MFTSASEGQKREPEVRTADALNGQQIEYVSQWTYLGTTIVSGKDFSFSPTNDLCSFFRSANSVLSVQRKPNELVQMNLLYSMCSNSFLCGRSEGFSV